MLKERIRIEERGREKGVPPIGGGTRARSSRTRGRGSLLASAPTMLTPPLLLLLSLLSVPVAAAIEGK